MRPLLDSLRDRLVTVGCVVLSTSHDYLHEFLGSSESTEEASHSHIFNDLDDGEDVWLTVAPLTLQVVRHSDHIVVNYRMEGEEHLEPFAFTVTEDADVIMNEDSDDDDDFYEEEFLASLVEQFRDRRSDS